MMPHNSAMWQSWNAWAHATQRQLQEQQEKINLLEQQYSNLQQQLQDKLNTPTYNVERLEYHFDQLKIETLEGTLNIGMAPPGTDPLQQIDQLAVPNAQPAATNTPVYPHQEDAALSSEIQREINLFLDHEAIVLLQKIEKESGTQLDSYHHRIIIEDIRKQLTPRIHYYLQSAKQSHAAKGSNDKAALKKETTVKTIQDVEAALKQYIQNLTTAPAAAGKPVESGNQLQNSGIDPFIAAQDPKGEARS